MRPDDRDHLLSLLSTSPMVIYTSRVDGDFGATSISDNVTEQLGYQPSDFLDDPQFWLDRIHPADRDRIVEGLAELFDRQTHAHEYRFRHNDGSWRWMIDQLRLSCDEHGEPIEVVGYWIDITDRKESERKLLASADRYRNLFETVPYGIEEADRDGIVVAANRAHHQLYGYPDGELIGRSILDFCATDEERERLRSYIDSARRERPTPTPYYGTKITRDGTLLDVEVVWSYRLDPAGEVVGFTALITDITERKRVEDALRESEERFALAVTGTDDGLWDANLQTGTEYWAPRFYSLLGYDVGEIESTGASFMSMVHPEDRPLIERKVTDHLDGRKPGYTVEYRIRNKSGEYRWFRSRARATCDEAGTPIRLVGFVSDITERRELESALRETQQILDSTPDPTVIVDEHDEIVLANSQAMAFGYGRSVLVGLAMTTLLPDFDRSLHGAVETDSTGIPSIDPGVELCARRSDGSEFPAEVRFSPIETESGTLLAAAIRDISDRVEAEQEQRSFEARLQQAQKLESLGILAGGIAHDFNNLLMAMLGNAEAALSVLPAASAAHDRVADIVSAAMQAGDLTRQMLAYSGKGQFVVEIVNFAALVAEIGRLLEASISKRVELRYRFADDVPAIEADASQIQQVIMNLIINASEAIGESNGVVTVSLRAVDLDPPDPSAASPNDDLAAGRYVCLEVEDTGCGMDDETRQRILDPFFTTKFTGRGLGLAAVLGIIRGHRGSLQIRSVPGVGSTFTVLLPAADEPADQPAVAASPSADLQSRGTVLVVDDVEAVRDAARAMIETLGLEVYTAVDGEMAVSMLRDHLDEIDVVLLDLTMPRMDGGATFRELRRICPDVPVILSSGFDEQETMGQFAGQGLAGFLQKPYRFQELVEMLEDALQPTQPDALDPAR